MPKTQSPKALKPLTIFIPINTSAFILLMPVVGEAFNAGWHLIIHSQVDILIRTINESFNQQFWTLMSITYMEVPAASVIVRKT